MGPSFGLRYLIDSQLFVVCPLLPTQRFVRYCKDRGVRASNKQTECFEELGIFYSVARVRYPKDGGEHPKTRLKFEEVNGRKIYSGKLE